MFCFTILEELLCLVELVGGTNQVGHPVLLQQLDVVVHRAILKQDLFSYFGNIEVDYFYDLIILDFVMSL